ncbi:MAG: hypothetical protein ACR2IK_15640 [Chloroflexota bacterium]
MAEGRLVVGIFRDRGQAKLAVAAALRQAFEVDGPETLAEDASGVHVTVHPKANPDEARRLLLQYGAYTVSEVEPGPA